MNITSDSIVKDVVKVNFKTAPVFQANHIDYCCGGNKTISAACHEAGINENTIIKELELVVKQQDPDSEYINSMEPDELSNYIVKRHHSYVRNNIPVITRNLEKICGVHGGHHPELFNIRQLFLASGGDLSMHMQKEELMLFPFIQRMVRAKRDKSSLPGSPFGTVSNPIRAMLQDHQQEGSRFSEISRLSNGYQVPPDGCTTYEVTLKQLRDFEDDLHRHIHLENNILFPKAIELESQL